MLRPLMYDDALCVNAAVEINELNYNVVVNVQCLELKARNSALASIVFIMQHAPCTLDSRFLANGREHGAAHCPPLQ